MMGPSKFTRIHLLLWFITANPSFLVVIDWQDTVNHNCIYVVHIESALSFTWGPESETAGLFFFYQNIFKTLHYYMFCNVSTRLVVVQKIILCKTES